MQTLRDLATPGDNSLAEFPELLANVRRLLTAAAMLNTDQDLQARAIRIALNMATMENDLAELFRDVRRGLPGDVTLTPCSGAGTVIVSQGNRILGTIGPGGSHVNIQAVIDELGDPEGV